MKNYLIYVAFVMPVLSNAQTTAKLEPKWNFGPKVDLALGAVDGNGIKSGFRAGVQLGAFANYQFSKKWSVQPELTFLNSNPRKGSDFMTYYVTAGRATAAEKINLWQMNVPVLARYNFSNVLSVVAGPQFSYMLFSDEDLVKNNVDAFKKIELSGNIGVEATVSKVVFSVRYNKGLSDINHIDDRYKWTSQHLMVGVAVKLR